MGVSVKRTVHVDVNRALKETAKQARKELLDLGVKRARRYVAKDTHSLESSIQKLNQYSYGVIGSRLAARNRRDYSGYQEGIWPTHTKFTPYLAPSFDDVVRATAGVVRKVLRRNLN